MKKIVLASGNQGKLREFNQLFSACDLNIVAQSEFNVSEVAETGLSFVENAIIKARHAAAKTGLAAIADDSGIEIDALQGAPGIYSARYAGEDATDEINNQKLLAALRNTPTDQRTARYQCVLVFMRHAADATPIICQGSWDGRIQETPSGNGGFGYDPLFYLSDYQCTAAELPAEQKNQISHRGIAMQALAQALRNGGHL